jgi:signal transduction histidine kinase
MRASLRARLLAFSGAKLLVFGLLVGVGFLLYQYRVLPMVRGNLAHKAEQSVAALATQLDMPLAAEDVAMMERELAPLLGDPDFLGIAVYRGNESLFYQHGAPPPRTQPAAPGRGQIRSRSVVAWTSIELEGLRLGSLVVSFSTRRVDRVARWTGWIAVVAAAVWLAAVLLSVRFSSSFVRPIQRMMEFSRSVADGNFAIRLEGGAPGELDTLVADLNRMTAALETRDLALAQRQRELERSLGELRMAQDELLQSTRLASVGELAGRMAHEVLNPITSVQGRLSVLLRDDNTVRSQNLMTLADITCGWEGAYARGGMPELVRSLETPVPDASGGRRPLISEDLAMLAGIRQYLAEDGESRRSDLMFLLNEVGRITRILDGMRVLTRPTSVFDTVLVSTPLDAALEICRDAAAKHNVTLEASGQVDQPIYVDRYEVIQVLTNLIRNGMQAIEGRVGRAGGAVTVSVQSAGERVHLRVTDTGTGIQPEHLPLLFESNFTTRPPHEGTGLGLSLARRLVRRAQGNLTIERTELGRGTTFLIDLPLAGERSPAHQPTATHTEEVLHAAG